MMARLLLLAGVAAIVIAGACRPKPVEVAESYIYTGTLWFDLDPDIVGQSFEDTVELAVAGGKFTFFTLVHTDQSGTNPPICDCEGNVQDFGSGSAVFDPITIDSTDCRAKWAISGEFVTVFNGDSLVMTRNDSLGGQMVEYLLRLSE